MKTITFIFAKRKSFCQFITEGAGVIATPENSIYLTIAGPEDIPSPPERMSFEEMAKWLRDLRGRGFSIGAVNGYNHPLKTDSDTEKERGKE
jgi:hypothetical protein